MSYQALARKWRPKQFKDVVGQQPVVTALIHSLNQQHVHHAYLFTGTRGVGKTTLARIFAKCLNCEPQMTAAPCEQCDNCLAVNEGRFIDLIEIDAASRTKVEDTREILDNVPYAPTKGRYKVYLIDEVHMLSGHSFNALLKTLEEPPEHVIFLLATTDPKKLPITILSRCIQFHLRNMPEEQIIQQLKHILSQENITFEATALDLIAQAAEGSMRDALSLLDQAIAHGQGQIALKNIQEMLGCIDHHTILELLSAVINQHTEIALNLCQNMLMLAADFQQVLETFLHLLTQIAIIQLAPSARISHENLRPALETLANLVSPEDIQLFYQIALTGRKDLPYAPTPKHGFEMLILRMIAFQLYDPASTNETSSSTPTFTATLNQTAVNPSPTVAPPTVTPITPASTETMDWSTLIQTLPLTGPISLIAKHCVLSKFAEDTFHLTLDSSQAALLSGAQQERLTQALSEYFQRPIKAKITVGGAQLLTPARQEKLEKDTKIQQAGEQILSDPKIQAILQQFNGKIAPGSIKNHD